MNKALLKEESDYEIKIKNEIKQAILNKEYMDSDFMIKTSWMLYGGEDYKKLDGLHNKYLNEQVKKEKENNEQIFKEIHEYCKQMSDLNKAINYLDGDTIDKIADNLSKVDEKNPGLRQDLLNAMEGINGEYKQISINKWQYERVISNMKAKKEYISMNVVLLLKEKLSVYINKSYDSTNIDQFIQGNIMKIYFSESPEKGAEQLIKNSSDCCEYIEKNVRLFVELLNKRTNDEVIDIIDFDQIEKNLIMKFQYNLNRSNSQNITKLLTLFCNDLQSHETCKILNSNNKYFDHMNKIMKKLEYTIENKHLSNNEKQSTNFRKMLNCINFIFKLIKNIHQAAYLRCGILDNVYRWMEVL